MSTSTFPGFPEGTIAFLGAITVNNSRDWFEAHRADYDQYYLEPALAFVEALGPRLRQISKTVRYEARINGSLFRIQRDIRFSKDKTPYKNHLDLWFWEGERRGWDTPGFFFRMTPDQLILGAGMHRLEKSSLDTYRQAIMDHEKGSALVAVLEEVRHSDLPADLYEIRGATRKSVPPGYDASHERAGLLLHEGITAHLEIPIPSEVHSPDFVDYCARHFRAMWPVNRWLLHMLNAGG